MEKQGAEFLEIELLNLQISHLKPKSGWNPLLDESNGNGGATRFDELPISEKTKEGLVEFGIGIGIEMSDLQRVCLPHALCGRDIFCLSKTHDPSSGKTLAFVIPVLEKLYHEGWGVDDGVGSIIICPTREIAHQTFQVLNVVGKHHDFRAGFLDVGVDAKEEHKINILITTPGPLLDHDFDYSKLEVLVLDEADHLDAKKLDAIISQLPNKRQTFLFSTTQKVLVQHLARISLKQVAEYLTVHAEFETDFPFPVPPPTPTDLPQYAIVASLDQKLDLLWYFLSTHSTDKSLVLLSTCQQVQFVFSAFKKLRPGMPLKCVHKGLDQERRMMIYAEFCSAPTPSVLLSTDEVLRGLDFNGTLDWVVQVDCPEDVNSYIHRLGRPARCSRYGNSVLFLMPSEMKMVEKLHAENVPIKVTEGYPEKVKPIDELLAYLLVEDSKLRVGAEEAFSAYLQYLHKRMDKEIFDVKRLPFNKFSLSMGLVITPSVSFQGNKISIEKISAEESSNSLQHIKRIYGNLFHEEEDDDDTLPTNPTRVSKEKRSKTRTKPARSQRVGEK